MQKMKKAIKWLLPLMLSGCATSYRLKVSDQNSADIKSQYVNGYEVAVSQNEESIVGVTGEKEEGHKLRLWVYVKNGLYS